ncbi:hypothetical protein M0R45_030193 [Rubus argutus]|uniref:Uncharacterized protein n=1 Tax=Rubus argutus TaxID=59490 RepID=A0AAW1WAJ8_RUBAR
MASNEVEVDDKAEWSTKNEGKFIRFGWDPIANIVTASEEVWATYIKRVPGVKPYRKKGLEHYDILGDIFNTTTATGQLHYASSQLPPNSDEERELEQIFLNNGVHINLDEDFYVNNPQTEIKGKGKVVTEAPSSDRRTKKWDKMEAYLEVCSEFLTMSDSRRRAWLANL